MHQPYTQLFVHLVWATWDRLPLIRPEIRTVVYGAIQDQLRRLRCPVIAIGGIEDHVHVLTRFPTTVTIAQIVKHAKGASSNLMTREIARGEFFKWQRYYGAFTVAKRQVPHVRTTSCARRNITARGASAMLWSGSSTTALCPRRRTA
jgi:putative transposase